ncbi:MAG: cob(I)yrinic acid a,c-diamide adenosyltransferase [Paludibacter sp.]|nr:cob(I)yrinic acid a,c-diamide adenosyltransferase [Paludibacter sp.]MDD4198050.1 cob(I)yrinic acid a,c-diamide adenosyltransferase [Paludibacter sp.]MDD4427025.1 cob(I)yrinic acid a,c-diamide adenosyltransferase [Paludibacter sp.]
MKIYTKTGDNGQTGLIGGTRVWKNNPRLETYGTIDELNAFIGMLTTSRIPDDILEFLQNIQHKLFAVGSHIATDQSKISLKAASIIREDDIIKLEKEIDRMDEKLPPLNNFVLPGGSASGTTAHVCRTVTRRAERKIMDLIQSDIAIDATILKYINRLSDYFFTLSRYLTVSEGYKEFSWKKEI